MYSLHAVHLSFNEELGQNLIYNRHALMELLPAQCGEVVVQLRNGRTGGQKIRTCKQSS